MRWTDETRLASERSCFFCSFFLLMIASVFASAQDLAPRAYIVTPVHSHAVILVFSFFDGGLVFDNSVPITGATARVNVPAFSYYHSLRFFGRSANFTGSLPYGSGMSVGPFWTQKPRLTDRDCLMQLFAFLLI